MKFLRHLIGHYGHLVVWILCIFFSFSGVFHRTRWNSINEAIIWWTKNSRCLSFDICYTKMWSSSILSFWWNRCSIRSPIQNCSWKYPNFCLFLFSLSKKTSEIHYFSIISPNAPKFLLFLQAPLVNPFLKQLYLLFVQTNAQTLPFPLLGLTKGVVGNKQNLGILGK